MWPYKFASAKGITVDVISHDMYVSVRMSVALFCSFNSAAGSLKTQNWQVWCGQQDNVSHPVPIFFGTSKRLMNSWKRWAIWIYSTISTVVYNAEGIARERIWCERFQQAAGPIKLQMRPCASFVISWQFTKVVALVGGIANACHESRCHAWKHSWKLSSVETACFSDLLNDTIAVFAKTKFIRIWGRSTVNINMLNNAQTSSWKYQPAKPRMHVCSEHPVSQVWSSAINLH